MRVQGCRGVHAQQFIHNNHIDMDRDVYEYRQFVCAPPLINDISTLQRTLEVTSNNKVIIIQNFNS